MSSNSVQMSKNNSFFCVLLSEDTANIYTSGHQILIFNKAQISPGHRYGYRSSEYALTHITSLSTKTWAILCQVNNDTKG
jgi:hypothetical protein